MQPDFTAFTEVAGRRFDLFVVEVKKPQQPKGQDLVKVGFMLRQMLTKLVEEKIERPQVYALIVDGYECTTYKMVIDHQFIFKLIEISQFLLPDRMHKIPCLETTVASLYQIKVIDFTLLREFTDGIII
ncbi:hypothetical protein BJV82DRAFT_594343 [Fennellomyces sp. T-0311]|nr:hypothetical protein BJV82DRAFT_594343 [Fennellomyces sp. T-0311]